jgi:Rieske Fe-S protein
LSCPTPPKSPCSRITVVTTSIPRRTILQGGVASALALTIPACGMGMEPVVTGPVAAGQVSDYTLNSLKLVPGINAFMGRDASGLYAMSAVCTHQGCLLGAVGTTGAQGVGCPCHGSQFDGNGAVVHGPAGRPLQHFRVDVDTTTGAITIQGGIPVDPTSRTPVI